MDTTSVFNWEANTSQPDLRYMPAVIRLLGYNPLPEAKTVGEQLVRHRTSLGVTQNDAARRIGRGSGHVGEVGARRTKARWSSAEHRERLPDGRCRAAPSCAASRLRKPVA